MSYDYNIIGDICDHRVSLERYTLDPFDWKTLHWYNDPSINLRAPVNSGTVELFIDGVIVEPSNPNCGYQLVKDSTRQDEDDFKTLMFYRPQRMLNQLIQLSYNTSINYCLKCDGTGQVNDLTILDSGTVEKTVDVSKLVQRCLKFLLTSKCYFYPSMTTPVRSTIGKKDSTVIDYAINSAILQMSSTIQQIQQVQATAQKLTPGEILKSIDNVQVVQDTSTPTLLHVSMEITPAGGDTTPVNFQVRNINANQ